MIVRVIEANGMTIPSIFDERILIHLARHMQVLSRRYRNRYLRKLKSSSEGQFFVCLPWFSTADTFENVVVWTLKRKIEVVGVTRLVD